MFAPYGLASQTRPRHAEGTGEATGKGAIMDDPATELALMLYRSCERADELQHTLNRMAQEVKSGPAKDLRILSEPERETPRLVLHQLDRLSESTGAAAELLKTGAGRLADGESWKGSDAWSAKLFRRIEPVPQALHALRANLAPLAERTDTPDPATPFAFDRIDRTCTENAEGLRELAADLLEAGYTLTACMATRPPPASSPAAPAADLQSPAAELADAGDAPSEWTVTGLAKRLRRHRTTIGRWARKAGIAGKDQGERYTFAELGRLAAAVPATDPESAKVIRELAQSPRPSPVQTC